MDYQSNEALALFNKSRHEIRGMQVVADDFVCLQKGRKIKVPGAALNTIGALIQQVGELAGITDFAIFSTWLSPLISRKVPRTEIYGTIIGHVRAACQGAPLEILLAKSRWLFPMYGEDPAHWVLGWIEPGPRLYHIFDSLPECNNVSWAEPALLELGDTVYATLGYMQVDWELWKRVLHSSSELERQMNGWACGFFVIHGMMSVTDGSGIETVTNRGTERVREKSLKLVFDNLPLFQPSTQQVQTTTIVLVEDIEMAGPNELLPIECCCALPAQSADISTPLTLRPIWVFTVGPAAPPQLMALHSHSKRGDHFVPITIRALLPPSTLHRTGSPSPLALLFLL
ncbi:hypothetical protein DFH08DRAFT_950966 [Mycena albidolilacea]|uniref:Ubiquitin-like protease family profile domain-containing protein n=1 Tax=Mycena albidolilacea TaxID=1033008 RepID=A0AAD7F2R5_9AGAR|nr:hypothetical protein DFH08DRAFT_950966 [Mycena albidolilacea]